MATRLTLAHGLAFKLRRRVIEEDVSVFCGRVCFEELAELLI